MAGWQWGGSSHKAGAYLAKMIQVAFNGTQRAFKNVERVALDCDRDHILGSPHPVHSTNGFTKFAKACCCRRNIKAMGRQRPASGGAPASTIEDELVYGSPTVTAERKFPGSGSTDALDVAEEGRA